MTITKSKKLKKYPTPVKIESGCKVGWNFYASRSNAEKCADIAKYNAKIRQQQGYDFGLNFPGSIIAVEGKYKVCVP